MSNKYWIDKTDGVDTILAENFNSAFAGIESDIAQKVDKVKGFGVGHVHELIGHGKEWSQVVFASGSPNDSVKIPAYTSDLENDSGFADKTSVDKINVTLEQTSEALSVLKQHSIPHTKVSDYPISVTDHLEAEQVIDYKVYGNSTQATRSGKNLLYSNTNTSTLSGVTLTYDNGTITLNGTCTTSANFDLNNIVLSAGTYTLSANANKVPVSNSYAFVQLYDTTNNQTITLNNSEALGSTTITISFDGTFLYRIRINEGTTYDNLVFKPQLELGSTATSYEQYGAMPSPEFPSEIQSVGDLVTDETSEYYGKYAVPIKVSGKNLLSKWYSNMHYSSCTKSKAIYMEPGTYNYHFERVDDTVTKWRYALSIFDVDGGESDRITGVTPYLAYRSTNGWYSNDYGIVQSTGDTTYSGAANVALTILKPCYIMWMWQLKNSSGTVLDAKQYAKNVMLEKGEQYTGYEDYAEPITANIYIDEPLRKVGDYADYIDYKNQKVFRQIEVLDGTGTKSIEESLGTLATPIEESIIVPNLTTPNSALLNVSAETITSPSKIDLTYYQDINKKLAELQEAITALGGI